MNSRGNGLNPKIIVRTIAVAVIVILACIILFSVRSSIAGLFVPQESDFAGLSNELNALSETPYFVSASWIGNPLNEVEVNGFASEDTTVDELRLVQCPMLLEIANSFVSDEYDLEVHVTNYSRVYCN